MKKVFYCIFFFLVLGVLTILDCLGVNALTVTAVPSYNVYNSSVRYHLSNDIEDTYHYYNARYPGSAPHSYIVERFQHLSEESLSDNTVTFSGLLMPVYVKANELNDYYETIDKMNVIYPTQFDNLYSYGENSSYLLMFRVYAKPESNEIQSGIFESYEVFSSQHFSSYVEYNSKKYQCLVTTVANSDISQATIACRVPKTVLQSVDLYFELDNRAYAQTDNATEYLENFWNFYLSDYVEVTGDDLGFSYVTSSVSGSDVTLNFSADRSDVVGYYYTVYNSSYDYEFTTSSTVTLSDFGNGMYNGFVKAVFSDGTETPITNFSFRVTDSPLPVIRYFVTYLEQEIVVDMRDSYATVGTLSEYCYQLDDLDPVCVSENQYRFQDVSYGDHSLILTITDSNGLSVTSTYGFRSKSPTEVVIDTVQSFIDTFNKQWNDMWNTFGDIMHNLFVPSDESLTVFFQDLRADFEAQFGFLSYPFTWILNFLERFYSLEDTGHYVISWSDISVPNFDFVIIEAGSFDLATLLENDIIRSMHNIYFIVINALCLLAFFKLCINILGRILDMRVDYSDTISVDESKSYETVDENTGDIVKRRETKKSTKSYRRHGL